MTIEDYYLWSLGLLEGPEADLIRTHLNNGCESCAGAVRASLEFWAVFGAAAGLESNVAPDPRLRAKLLENIRTTGGSGPKVVPLRRSRVVYAGAIAAALFLVAGLGFQFGLRRRPPARPANTQVANVQLDGLKQQVIDLQRKLSEAEKEVQSLTRTRSTNVLPVRLSQTPATDCRVELDRALNDANQQLQQLRTALAGEQAKSTRLAQEFDQQAAAVATITRERRDAEANLAAANGRLAERDRQIKALDAKIGQLERERDRLNDTLQNEKKRIEQSGRLVALLGAPTTKLVRLAGTEAAPRAGGYALLAEGRKLIFTGSNLPALQPGRAYQLWLMRGRGPGIVSAGVFGGDQMTIEFTGGALLQDVRALAVTEEPKGGSPLPTGHKLLVGTSRS